MSHTEGPWIATANGVHTSSGKCVALTHMEPREQRYADARLIAASPDLLAAADDALCECLLQGSISNQCLEKLQLAIYKARGIA